MPEGFVPLVLGGSSQRGRRGWEEERWLPENTVCLQALPLPLGTTERHRRGEASHRGISGLVKGGKFSPMASLLGPP